MSRPAYEGTHPMTTCAHLDHVRITELPDSVEGCQECLAAGDPWLHLRICLECGKVGCCDSSPNRHASRHAESSGHPIIRSLESGEDWSWCFRDQVGLLIPDVKGARELRRRRWSRLRGERLHLARFHRPAPNT